MVAADPLRGGPVGAATLSGLSPTYSPGPSGSLGKKIVNFLTNEDEQTVLEAEHLAFYKGVPVVKVTGSSSFSLGIIFMGDEGDENLLKHEYGHTKQLASLGFGDYLSYVVLPSVSCYWGTTWGFLPPENYYSYPWEYQADQLGDATHTYQPWANVLSDVYWGNIR